MNKGGVTLITVKSVSNGNNQLEAAGEVERNMMIGIQENIINHVLKKYRSN
jgi:hypothetical protein